MALRTADILDVVRAAPPGSTVSYMVAAEDNPQQVTTIHRAELRQAGAVWQSVVVTRRRNTGTIAEQSYDLPCADHVYTAFEIYDPAHSGNP